MSSAPARRGPSGGGLELGQRLPADASTRACRSAARATRCSISRNPAGVDAQIQRDSLDALKALNKKRLDAVGDPEIATRINSFEMAYRMQSSGPELMDIGKESQETLEMYGAEPGKPSFANNCLLARRLVERGVRFVQLFHEAWDQHGGLTNGLKDQCAQDRPGRAPRWSKDLKQRGLLDDTLVIWGGEFGRTPMVQGGNDGRDHHPNAFTDVAGRRRHQAGHDARRDRTTSASTRSRTRSTSTTCTRRSCTCSASTTPS